MMRRNGKSDGDRSAPSISLNCSQLDGWKSIHFQSHDHDFDSRGRRQLSCMFNFVFNFILISLFVETPKVDKHSLSANTTTSIQLKTANSASMTVLCLHEQEGCLSLPVAVYHPASIS